jgi:hypothetical protein
MALPAPQSQIPVNCQVRLVMQLQVWEVEFLETAKTVALQTMHFIAVELPTATEFVLLTQSQSPSVGFQTTAVLMQEQVEEFTLAFVRRAVRQSTQA